MSLSGKVGLRAVAYYMATTVLAVVLGIVLVVSIKPGEGGIDAGDLQETVAKRNITTADTLMDLLRNCFPLTLSRQVYSSTRQLLSTQEMIR